MLLPVSDFSRRGTGAEEDGNRRGERKDKRQVHFRSQSVPKTITAVRPDIFQ